jgi:hypothetical protein
MFRTDQIESDRRNQVVDQAPDRWRNHNFMDKQFQVDVPIQPDPDGAEYRLANA